MKNLVLRLFPIIMSLLIVSFSLHANIIVVNTAEDATVADANCSIREAIIAANNDISYEGCTKGLGADVIVFALGAGHHTIELQSPLLIRDALNIIGPGGGNLLFLAGLHAADSAFILDMDNPQAHDFSLQGVVIGNASNSAMIIMNADQVTIADVRFASNHAQASITRGGAIHAVSDVTGAVTDYLGGLTIIDSEFAQNSAFNFGGAIAIRGNSSLSIAGSIFENNTATLDGGAIYLYDSTVPATIKTSSFINNSAGVGGAIANYFESLSIEQSYFTHNSSPNSGTIFASTSGGDGSSLVKLINNTFGNNTSGTNPGNGVVVVENDVILEVSHNTFADNDYYAIFTRFFSGSPDVHMSGNIFSSQHTGNLCGGVGDFFSHGYNIDSNGSSCASAVNDLPNTEPQLLPAADNGGPTLTMQLKPTSPAVDGAGVNCTEAVSETGVIRLITIDQRGEDRPKDGDANGTGKCDLGAFERPDAQNLFLDFIGTGAGKVNLDQFDLTCDSEESCTWPLPESQAYSITAVADNGSAFISWHDACSGDTTCNVTMNIARTVVAEFLQVANPAQLTVDKDLQNPQLNLTVTSSPAGINCGNDCSAGFIEGDLVTLVAEVEPGTLIDSWQNCDIVLQNGRLCRIGLTGDTTITINAIADPDIIFANGFE